MYSPSFQSLIQRRIQIQKCLQIIKYINFKLNKTFLKKQYLKFLIQKHFVLKKKIFLFFKFLNFQIYNLNYQLLFLSKKIKKNYNSAFQIEFKNILENSAKYAYIKINVTPFNIFMTLLNLKGNLLSWSAAGHYGFSKKLRIRKEVVDKMCAKIVNACLKQKIKYVKIQNIGPSKRYFMKFFIVLRKSLWKQKIVLRGFSYLYHKPFNGCRLKKPRIERRNR